MRIYFFISDAKSFSKARIAQTILSMESLGYLVLTNFCDHEQSDFLRNLNVAMDPRTSILDKVDFFIIEGSQASSEAAYLVAWAFSVQKPILYLLQKGCALDPALKIFQEGTRAGKLFKVKYYAERKFKEHILQGISAMASAFKAKEREFANIKFTLRIMPSIERYINWKAKRRKTTKANFLRFLLDQMMSEDAGFQNYINKKVQKK